MPDRSLDDLVARLARDLETPPSAPVRVSGLRGSASALCLARVLAARPRPVLVLVADSGAAEAFAGDLRFFLGAREVRGPLGRRVQCLPGWEVPPFEPLSPTRETVAARAEGLYHLLGTPDPVVVTTVEAWGQRCLPWAVFVAAATLVAVGPGPFAWDVREVEGHRPYEIVGCEEDPARLLVRAP